MCLYLSNMAVWKYSIVARWRDSTLCFSRRSVGLAISVQNLDIVGALECLGIPHAALAHESPDMLQRFEFSCIEPCLKPGKQNRQMAGAFSQ